ncbi:bifunctional diaminohydroxyphosphoribosylaminopyrimidine deaminase/5-amino-6-(5-phosphoribosylamino)uracil reductase RibD [Demequina aurantiaca]|uniref:bifunctional diaminohydroxyphosphoribosylaminopyrimidine deaminase/5-amino-6-(5-phosphoribosylamino)uracil reductase RibD n=1 Tax=Demequina aurantiaca TaxID=676200 RepID=UPI0009FBB6A0|nr:bifunctional diaminohydroxyphosphoribosylaminopyrimidine deaminase/5-amino-6-(5-phosphoribosylamino)uracil reductase RibD [Demequina aurantiaca]
MVHPRTAAPERTIIEQPGTDPTRHATLGPSQALDRAVELAARGPAHGPNPRVGCVITDASGLVLGEGWHQGAGTPHAEPAALSDAETRGNDVSGATAYVTLEPCSHTGRTGPCTDALTNAGISTVRYAVEDPNPEAAGGGQVLRDRGIDAVFAPHAGAAELNARWLASIGIGRPYVIAKWAATLDGRTAAVDGTSVWITGDEAREHAHSVRAEVDAIVVGTGTVLTDNPSLSARVDGSEVGHQPLRVVMGLRDTSGRKVWRDDNAVAMGTHDPAEVLAELHDREARVALIEGGAAITTAFLSAGLVDEIHAYIAPAILGAGTSAVGDLGISTMHGALRGQDVSTRQLGADTLVIAHVAKGI